MEFVFVDDERNAGAFYYGVVERYLKGFEGRGGCLNVDGHPCALHIARAAQGNGLLDPVVAVDTRGGPLTIRWEGAENALNCAVWLTGPAVTVFEGEIQIDES